ncbi:BF3164 family lipoprotein [Chitinophaga rhizosphaerae]|uniref:BF3164 family lipoprotein n=1 Tax=Chitinophaga rhizosphaerae TaxID=1864947 RepID=UPI000F811030|nr:BF3164 family lipoprotein [Chitinophaga rhizosphaerae]
MPVKLSLLLPLLALISCFASSNGNKEENQFPKIQSIKSQHILKTESNIASLHIQDSFLVLRHTQSSYDYLLSFVNLKSQATDISFDKIKFGGDPGEVLSPLSCGLYSDSLFLVQDISSNKLVVFNLGKTPDKKAPTSYKEFNLPKFLYSMCLLDTALNVIANGDNASLKELQIITAKEGKIVKEFGEYSNASSKETALEWKNKHESFLFIKPDGKKLVSAARYTDQIELFDLVKHEKIKTVRGPDNFKPELGYQSMGGFNKIIRNSKTRYAFLGGATTDNYIYLLYSGNKCEGPHQFYGNSIFIYRWNGAPVARLNLDKYVSSIAVSKDDKELYAVDPAGKQIIKSSIIL